MATALPMMVPFDLAVGCDNNDEPMLQYRRFVFPCF